MNAPYKCGNCGRLLGNAEQYIEHFRGCHPKPAEEPEAPLVWPDRTFHLTDYDQLLMDKHHKKVRQILGDK